MTNGVPTAHQLPRLSQPRISAAEEKGEDGQIINSVSALDGLQAQLLGRLDLLRFGARLPKERLAVAALGEPFQTSLPRTPAVGRALQKSSSASCVKASRSIRVDSVHSSARHGAAPAPSRSAVEEDCAGTAQSPAVKGQLSSHVGSSLLPAAITKAAKKAHEQRATPAREVARGSSAGGGRGQCADGGTRAADAARGHPLPTVSAPSTRSTGLASGTRKSGSSPCLLGPAARTPPPPKADSEVAKSATGPAARTTPPAKADSEVASVKSEVLIPRPSLLALTHPTNLNEARKHFFECGCTIAPKFQYSISDDAVTQLFGRYSEVCFTLLDEAKRILKLVQGREGGVEAFEKKVNGDLKIPPYQVREMVVAYIMELDLPEEIFNRIDIRIVDGVMSPASCAKKGELYIVTIKNSAVSKGIIQGICDHEIGTHLLRMINDELQIWHRNRGHLADPLATEEGLATLNQHLNWPSNLFYTQALSYYAVCRGVQLGFVELFQELMAGYVSDPIRCWDICCRTKRGLVDTAMPGSFFKEQVYFKGMVEVLSRIDDIKFEDLYAGQVALSDLGGAASPIRRKDVQLPMFLDNTRKQTIYRAHCKDLIRENKLERAVRAYS